MNGAQDLGGMMGFGPVRPEADEPPFHADWEARALALTLAIGATGSWPLDAARFARESLPPADYLSFSYYRIWTTALIGMLIEHGFITGEELATGMPSQPPRPVNRILKAADVASTLGRGGPTSRDIAEAPAFKPGDKVRTRNINPMTHTRLPRYLRRSQGEIVRHHGAHVFPDTNAHGGGENPKHLYTVRFSARDLWGDDHRADDHVMADLWEPYLVAA